MASYSSEDTGTCESCSETCELDQDDFHEEAGIFQCPYCGFLNDSLSEE